MSELPRETVLGNLRLLETYDYYDGPRLFSARNLVGTTFLALWADELKDRDVWLYVPVSEERLSALREGAMPIREAFLRAEDRNAYRVTLERHSDAAHAETVRSSDIPMHWLPPEGDRIDLTPSALSAMEPVETQVVEPLGRIGPVAWIRSRGLQHVTISRGEGRLPPPLEVVTDILGRWRHLFEETARPFSTSVDMLPVRASPGSFKIDLAVGDPAAASAAFRSLVELSSARSGERLGVLLKGGPTASFRKFLCAVANHGVSIRVNMDGVSDGDEIALEAGDAGNMAAHVLNLYRARLSSEQVPQADDLARVFRVVELVDSNVEVTAERLGVVHRQVNYYKHAARVLGYLDSSNALTSSGGQVLRLDPKERLKTAAVQFEASDCGSAWITWTGGTSLAEVSGDRAEQFLSTMSDLSASTASRRAKTLQSWLEILLPYHYRNWMKPQG